MSWHNVKCCLLVLNRVCLCVHIGVDAECERSYGAGNNQSPGRSCDRRDGHQHETIVYSTPAMHGQRSTDGIRHMDTVHMSL